MAYQVINGKLTKVNRDSHKVRSRLGWSPYPEPVVTQVRNTDYEPPALHKLKGKYQGRCNRTACQDPEAVIWYNTGTRAYYCWHCAYMINTDGCQRYGDANICHKVTGFNADGSPQFDPTLPLKHKRDYHPTEEERNDIKLESDRDD